jgi:hypothetical protein
MSKITYTYAIVRYRHDPAAGEMLNIGVLLYAPARRYFGLRLEQHFKRLSEAFAGFDGEQYRRTVRQFEQAIGRLWNDLTEGIPGMFDLPPDVGSLVAQVWPDQDLSFSIGPMLAGVTDNPEQTMEAIYRRMVLDQYERPIVENRTDEDVWSRYYRPLPIEVKKALHEKTIETPDYELKFPHAFKNGQWHLLQPVTLDYTQNVNLQEKASRWLGRSVLLRDNQEIAKLYLLLGAPRQEDHRNAYNRAKNILNKMPIRHQIVEEDEAADFAIYLQDYMKDHGLLQTVEATELARQGETE